MNESNLLVFKYNAEQYCIRNFERNNLFDIMDNFLTDDLSCFHKKLYYST